MNLRAKLFLSKEMISCRCYNSCWTKPHSLASERSDNLQISNTKKIQIQNQAGVADFMNDRTHTLSYLVTEQMFLLESRLIT